MYLKKKGTALISTMVILALMSTLGFFMFKMMKNNNELEGIYEVNKDVYDLDKDEEETLYKFMVKLNERYKESQLNGGDTSIENLLSQKLQIDSSIFGYDKDHNKITLTTKDNNNIIKEREILYVFKDEKIILIPTYKFEISGE